MDKKIKNCIKVSKKIKAEIEKLEILNEKGADCSAQLKELQFKLNDHEENVYAKIIFDIYSIKRPKLVRVRTKDVVDWEEAFGKDFSKLARSDKYALIGLFENGGKYKFK